MTFCVKLTVLHMFIEWDECVCIRSSIIYLHDRTSNVRKINRFNGAFVVSLPLPTEKKRRKRKLFHVIHFIIMHTQWL